MLSCILRKVTLDEEDGTQTEWVLLGWREGKTEHGHHYVALVLANGSHVREDVQLEPLQFNAFMHDRGTWPFIEMVEYDGGRDMDSLPAAPAWPLMARAREVVIEKPITQSCPCAKPRCKGQCLVGYTDKEMEQYYAEAVQPEPEEWFFLYSTDGRFFPPRKGPLPDYPGFDVAGPYASAEEANAALDGWLKELGLRQ